jgi:hypothetical protein
VWAAPRTKTIREAEKVFLINLIAEDRIERALEDDYLSRDPSISKRAAYIQPLHSPCRFIL